MTTLKDIIKASSGRAINCEGCLETEILTAKPLNEAEQGHMTLARKSLKNAGEALMTSRASLFIIDEDLPLPDNFTKPAILCTNARLEFMTVLDTFFAPKPAYQIHPSAVIGENVTIGEGTIIHPNVTIYDNVTIGKDCVIHSGCVIGADGYGFERNEKNEIVKFPHIGGVVIGDNVEVMALTHIARGTLGNTVIGEGCKIDSLCHIAHNVQIGKHCMIIACSLIGGSTVIGDYCYIAPCASLINKITIGEGAFVGMSSFVNKDVAAGATVIGSPARPFHKK